MARRLALTLSGSGGNLDIWLLDLRTQQLTRLTDDPAVDTEPAWSPDGMSIYFTSDRAGGPQIYKLEIAQPKRVERITFGSTTTRARACRRTASSSRSSRARAATTASPCRIWPPAP